jgi:hypothetical protein
LFEVGSVKVSFPPVNKQKLSEFSKLSMVTQLVVPKLGKAGFKTKFLATILNYCVMHPKYHQHSKPLYIMYNKEQKYRVWGSLNSKFYTCARRDNI